MQQLGLLSELVIAWTGRIIRARYQQSVMGWLWAVIQPAAYAATITVVFSMFLRVDAGGTPYLLFSYLAMVSWTFLSASLLDMADSLVQNMALVTKIYFPREALPVSAMLARLLDLSVAGVLLIPMLLYYRVPLHLGVLLYLPIILLIQVALVLGLGLMSAATNVFYRDVQPLMRLVVQLWFYASPVIYPVTFVPERIRSYYYLNPMVGIIEAYRSVLFHGTAPDSSLLVSAAVALLLLAAGYWLFIRVQHRFADIV